MVSCPLNQVLNKVFLLAIIFAESINSILISID